MLEDVLNLMAISLYGEANAMSVTFKEEDEYKLQRVTSIGHSKASSSSKSHMIRRYTTLMRVRGVRAG